MIKLLLVDDSPVDRILAERLLEKDEHVEVTTAGNGLEALERIGESRPDVVLTDVHMPEMNGVELLQAVIEQNLNIPVVLMTSKGTEDVAVAALQAGAASYVPKRRLATDLLDTIHRVWLSTTDRQEDAVARNRLQSTSLSFRVEPDLTAMLAIARYLRDAVVDLWSCPHKASVQLCTALEEALTNAYYYGCLDLTPQMRIDDAKSFYNEADRRAATAPWNEAAVTVRGELNPGRAEFVVEDPGKGFDPDTLPDPDSPDNFDQPVGRGLQLIRAFMDEVRFNDAGNQIAMIKHRSHA